MTGKEQLFVAAYLQSWNVTAAARAAGYCDPNRNGNKISKKKHIQEAIRAMMTADAASAEEVTMRVTQQARANAADFFEFETAPVLDKDGNPRMRDDGEPLTRRVMVGIRWDEIERRGYLIKGIRYGRRGEVILEFHDSQAALKILAQMHGLLVDRHELSGPGGGALQILGIEVVKPDESAAGDSEPETTL